MSIGRFHIPGESTRRNYAVYVMLACHRQSRELFLYVGKTGDNKEGCNPVISRGGNHFSFNKVHSQMRNKLPTHAHDFDFDFFYATFGEYCDPRESRAGIEVINEMERRLNELVQVQLPRLTILNLYRGKSKLNRSKRDFRKGLATAERLAELDSLVAEVDAHVKRLTIPT